MTTEHMQAAIDLLNPPRTVPISSSAYDTAMVAMSCAGRPEARDLVAAARTWLLGHQHDDGSWGGTLPEPHDRLVCTLAAVLALHSSPSGSAAPNAGESVDRGLRYLAELVPRLRVAIAETPGAGAASVAFELIVPYLAHRAATLGLDVCQGSLGWIEEARRRKLGSVPGGAIVGTTLAHTVEALGRRPDDATLAELVGRDGSVACSPAAAAFVYAERPNPATLRFLRGAMAATPDGGVPNIYPFAGFEQAFVLLFLAIGRLDAGLMRSAVQGLSTRARAGRLAAAHGLPADADDTGVLLYLRRYCGLDSDSRVLDQFETTSGYASYDYEMGISTSTNSHVLMALRAEPVRSTRRIELAVSALRRARVNHAYWTDKWNISPYYATSQAMIAVDGIAPDLRHDATDWMLATQRDEGSWGIIDGTCEETAYAVLALMSGTSMTPAALAAVDRGMRYLQRHKGAESLPEMWIGKTLYTPFRIVHAAVAAAHLRYQHLPMDQAALA